MALSLYKRYEKWWPVVFFLLGFVYDVATLDRIDSVFGIIKHTAYLSTISAFLALEILALAGKFAPTGRLGTAWKYHELVMHFLLGSLLSEYTLFFFKSASLWSSVVFLLLLGSILLLNEFKEFKGNSGVPVRVALFSLCLITYFLYLVPVIRGFVGTGPFVLSIAAACLVVFIITTILRKRLPGNDVLVREKLLLPFGGVLGAIVALYVLHWIPPIPVAVRYMGIFHEVKKEQGAYHLGYTRPRWKFWQRGDQAFSARPGDKLYCFVRIFSPAHFRDQVQIRWLFDDPRLGWQMADVIPISITGGRDEGFRGFTFKSKYQPGDWQVRAETTDGRELGRIYFSIEPDESTGEREIRYDTH